MINAKKQSVNDKTTIWTKTFRKSASLRKNSQHISSNTAIDMTKDKGHKFFIPFKQERDSLGRLLPTIEDYRHKRERSLPLLGKTQDGFWSLGSIDGPPSEFNQNLKWSKDLFNEKLCYFDQAKENLFTLQVVNRIKKLVDVQENNEKTLPNACILNRFKELLHSKMKLSNLKPRKPSRPPVADMSILKVSYTQTDKNLPVFVYRRPKLDQVRHAKVSLSASLDSSINRIALANKKPNIKPSSNKSKMKSINISRVKGDAIDPHSRDGFKPNSLKSTYERRPSKHFEIRELFQQVPSIAWNKLSSNLVLNDKGLHKATKGLLSKYKIKNTLVFGLKRSIQTSN